MVAALTLLPAVLRLLGDRVNKGRIPFLSRHAKEDTRHGFWARAVHLAMRRPAISAALACGLLLIAAIPALSLHTGAAGISSLPDNLSAKQGFVALNRDFSAGAVTPADIVVDGPVGTPTIDAAIASLTEDACSRLTASALPPSNRTPQHDLAVISVPVAGDSTSEAAEDAVKTLRNDAIPAAFDGTERQRLRDRRNRTEPGLHRHHRQTYLPIVFALVLGLSFILLLVAFRSIVVPLHEHRHEPAVGGRRLRPARVRDPEGPRRRAVRIPRRADHRGLDPAVPVLRAVRPLHGLPGVPALAHPRALRPHRETLARRSPTASAPPPT